MHQQMFAQQQQLLFQKHLQQNVAAQQKTAEKSPTTSPQKTRNKLSIDEILKQRVKPTQVSEQQDDQPTDTSGSNNDLKEDSDEEAAPKAK
jgi:hypothetical protein